MNSDVQKTPDVENENVDYIEIEKVKYKINYYYDGEVSFIDLIKTALKRNAESFLRQLENN